MDQEPGFHDKRHRKDKEPERNIAFRVDFLKIKPRNVCLRQREVCAVGAAGAPPT